MKKSQNACGHGWQENWGELVNLTQRWAVRKQTVLKRQNSMLQSFIHDKPGVTPKPFLPAEMSLYPLFYCKLGLSGLLAFDGRGKKSLEASYPELVEDTLEEEATASEAGCRG